MGFGFSPEYGSLVLGQVDALWFRVYGLRENMANLSVVKLWLPGSGFGRGGDKKNAHTCVCMCVSE